MIMSHEFKYSVVFFYVGNIFKINWWTLISYIKIY